MKLIVELQTPDSISRTAGNNGLVNRINIMINTYTAQARNTSPPEYVIGIGFSPPFPVNLPITTITIIEAIAPTIAGVSAPI